MHHSDDRIAVKPEWEKNAHVNKAKYKDLYQQSIQDPEGFWAKQAERITWTKKWNKVKDTSFKKPVHVKWFEGGKLNASYNCIDRHLESHADRVAFFWEPDSTTEETLTITYRQLHEKVCRLANVMKANGVKKGDRVTIYMPMIPEAVYSMLACARIGAIHSVVFGGFSPDSLATRIQDCDSEFLITADEGYRGGKAVPLKVNADEAAKKCPGLKKMLVVQRTKAIVDWDPKRDIWYHEAIGQVSDQCEPEVMD
ncbi:MAG: AMP-binding protein, partial [Bdellovibrionales bacterium]|nr:AMP-binding protein [Bdellovibrionales bacterium]